MKLNATVHKFLTNTYVLNFVFFVSILYIIGLVIYRNYEAVIYFILIGLLVAYFSKNMVIILGIPLILVNLLSKKSTIFEGATNMDDSVNALEETDVSDSAISDSDSNSNKPKTASKNDDNVQPKKADNKAAGGNKKEKYNIDYASTIEEAYDNLNSVIGGDGMSNLTKDTQRLMLQQQQLAKTMESMGPIVEKMAPMLQSAQSMLSNMNMGAATGDPKNPLANLTSVLSNTKKTN
jgi:hypothetical protein